MKAILSILVLFGILAALPEDKLLTSSQKSISVSATEYFNAYQANPETANKKYKDKKIQLTGRVSYINSSCPDNPYLMVDGVECAVKNAADLQSFEIGDEIKVSGKGIGSAINIPFLTQCNVELSK
ncbi:MAG: hypothetical protein JSS70_19520 [Bacteroidetes bacterium]|nr:hypothetical protein [Bacteroidota bacterium]